MRDACYDVPLRGESARQEEAAIPDGIAQTMDPPHRDDQS